MKRGDQLIAEERAKQVLKLDFDQAHDSQWKSNELLRAAQCYLNHVIARGWRTQSHSLAYYQGYDGPPDDWPWDPSWWRPESPEKDMIKAAALIAAEYDRRTE